MSVISLVIVKCGRRWFKLANVHRRVAISLSQWLENRCSFSVVKAELEQLTVSSSFILRRDGKFHFVTHTHTHCVDCNVHCVVIRGLDSGFFIINLFFLDGYAYRRSTYCVAPRRRLHDDTVTQWSVSIVIFTSLAVQLTRLYPMIFIAMISIRKHGMLFYRPQTVR